MRCVTAAAPDPSHDAIAPLDVDGVSAMTFGTVLWVVALLVLLLSGTRPSADNGWWLWVCLAGAGIGVVGIIYSRRRREVYRAAARASSTPGAVA